MVDLAFDDGSKLTATDGHPFWDVSTGLFTEAVDLMVGELVLTLEGQSLKIISVRVHGEDLTAYNLEIEGIHTYYAGVTPVLVHNDCPPQFRGTNMSDEASFDYHYAKHGDGASPEQYLADAQSWAQNPAGIAREIELKNGQIGREYRQKKAPGGIMDLAGNIISFWYRP